MSDCIFCKIASKEINAKIVYEDDEVLAFEDINPMAPVHVLLIPKKHIAGANGINSENSSVVAHIFEVAPKIAKQLGVSESGYRLVTNCGKDAGQSVMHLHFHLLGGKALLLKLG